MDRTSDDVAGNGEDPLEGEDLGAVGSVLEDDPGDPDVGPPVPEAPDPNPEGKAVDPRLRKRFWSLVIVFNVALFALSLGVMFVGFEGDLALGGRLVAIGAVAGAFGLYYYRKTKRELIDAGDGADGD